jgi:hypothetical protein
MSDNQFITPSQGQADWDASLTADLGILERGFHWTERAGVAINTGNVVWLSSGGFAYPFDPNSKDVFPHGLAFTAASSGDALTALAWGIVRSLGINSPAISGQALYVSPLTPGLVVGSYVGADRQIGWGLLGNGVLFNPSKNRAPNPDFLFTNTFVAGAAVNTGYAVWLNAANQAVHFDPNSENIQPHGIALTGAAGVGSGFVALLKGIVRSLGITSAAGINQPVFTSALTPGILVGSYNGAFRRVGTNVGTFAIMIDPQGFNYLPETLNSSISIAAVTGSLHTFTVGVGRRGIDRELVMIGNSADLVELKFYSDAARGTLLYATKSGGVSTVGSFQDRAMWPWENTDAVNSASIYGTLKIMSAALVGSDAISVRGAWDRYR